MSVGPFNRWLHDEYIDFYESDEADSSLSPAERRKRKEARLERDVARRLTRGNVTMQNSAMVSTDFLQHIEAKNMKMIGDLKDDDNRNSFLRFLKNRYLRK